jgi:hypothetical protein
MAHHRLPLLDRQCLLSGQDDGIIDNDMAGKVQLLRHSVAHSWIVPRP